MTHKEAKIFAPSKVNIDHQKVEDYLNGKPIYPTTIEMDLTQLCSRSCEGCPYGVARQPGLTLQMPFLDRFFSIMGPHTPGIVFSGGESTIVPHFPETLALARRKGFKEIAIISNGANIDQPAVQNALLEHATSIRISMYEWQDAITPHFTHTLKKIEQLRNRIEREGSKLEIGASMLTRSEWNHRYQPVGLQALDSGIHWLYFHPYCVDWDQEYPKQADQIGVLEAIATLKAAAPAHTNIQVPAARYDHRPLFFEKLHGSHFLIQVGADGINYAGPENKYEPEYALLDLNEYLEEDFLWQPQRLGRLDAINSDNYRFIGTKHRPPMFSDYIQYLIQARREHDPMADLAEPAGDFSYPNII
jgi:hypothetical protein